MFSYYDYFSRIDAIAKFDQPVIPQLFSVLFFLMLFTLGVGSATALTSGVIRIIHDQFPSIKKLHITILVCFAGFLSGLIYVTPVRKSFKILYTIVSSTSKTLLKVILTQARSLTHCLEKIL